VGGCVGAERIDPESNAKGGDVSNVTRPALFCSDMQCKGVWLVMSRPSATVFGTLVLQL
jgi:hypothetical protein